MASHSSRSPLRSRVLRRGLASVAAGILASLIVVPILGWLPGLLAGWTAIAIVSVVWLLIVCWPMDATQTREHAISEDPGRAAARVIAVVGSVISLGAVVAVLVGSHGSTSNAVPLAVFAILAVTSSWALIQVDYMLRYAHRYYSSDADGARRGIDFNQDPDPEYSDFGYFSVGLGMTYQVADTDVTTNEIRRIVIAQTLLAYLFGAVILATVINLVSGLG